MHPTTFLEAARAGIDAGWHRAFQAAIWTPALGLRLFNLGEAQPGIPVDECSLCLWLSSGKPFTPLALARLHDRGLLDWDDPVGQWLPEFCGGGKESLSLRHLLTHTGGFREADKADPSLDWADSIAHACAAPLEPGWIPGETGGYHANGSWFILGEILQRATRRPFQEVIQTEVLAPLGLSDAWFGMPVPMQEQFRDRLVPVERTGRVGTGLDPVLNARITVTRCRPGSGLRAPASTLCQLYRALLDPPEGWLRPETLAALTAPQRRGIHDRTFQAVIDFGLGFILNTPRPDGAPMPYGYGAAAGPRTFGHSGNQSSCAFADPDARLAVAWACNGLPGEPVHQRRQHQLNTALYRDLGLG